ncbi:unnamed protein product [Trichogramma brassicae]|uniref:Uncharacterized protein n=1 Tax=Trichogramma brassicae TaxID=86971 RepID=A0A6H5INY3_9HYME|nr:unnamed protein product [Trichogramma brassicae]
MIVLLMSIYLLKIVILMQIFKAHWPAVMSEENKALHLSLEGSCSSCRSGMYTKGHNRQSKSNIIRWARSRCFSLIAAAQYLHALHKPVQKLLVPVFDSDDQTAYAGAVLYGMLCCAGAPIAGRVQWRRHLIRRAPRRPCSNLKAPELVTRRPGQWRSRSSLGRPNSLDKKSESCIEDSSRIINYFEILKQSGARTYIYIVNCLSMRAFILLDHEFTFQFGIILGRSRCSSLHNRVAGCTTVHAAKVVTHALHTLPLCTRAFILYAHIMRTACTQWHAKFTGSHDRTNVQYTHKQLLKALSKPILERGFFKAVVVPSELVQLEQLVLLSELRLLEQFVLLSELVQLEQLVILSQLKLLEQFVLLSKLVQLEQFVLLSELMLLEQFVLLSELMQLEQFVLLSELMQLEQIVLMSEIELL